MEDFNKADNLKSYFINSDGVTALSTIHVSIPHVSFKLYPFLSWFDRVVLLEPAELYDIEGYVDIGHGYLSDDNIDTYATKLPINTRISRLTLTREFCRFNGDTVIDLLDKVISRHRVEMVRLIVGSVGRDDTGVVEWCEINNIQVDVISHVTATRPDTLNRHTYISGNLDVLNSNLLFDGKKLFIEHPSRSVAELAIPSNPEQLIVEYLRLKATTYARYANEISTDCSSTSGDQKHLDYFQYASSALQVSSNPSFIPKLVVFPTTKLYDAFIRHGWFATKLGLVKPHQTAVVPVYMLSATPKQRIEHFQVRSKPK